MGVLHPFPQEVCVSFKISLYTYTNFPFVLHTGKSPTGPNFDMTKRAAPLLATSKCVFDVAVRRLAPPCQRCPPNTTSLPHFRHDNLTNRAAPSLPTSTHDFNMARRGCLLALTKSRFNMTKRAATLFAMSNPRAGLYTHGLLKTPYPCPRVWVSTLRAWVVAGVIRGTP